MHTAEVEWQVEVVQIFYSTQGVWGCVIHAAATGL